MTRFHARLLSVVVTAQTQHDHCIVVQYTHRSAVQNIKLKGRFFRCSFLVGFVFFIFIFVFGESIYYTSIESLTHLCSAYGYIITR